MKEQWLLFLTALQFYTRIPVGDLPRAVERLNKATRYLPLVGWLIGGMIALVLYLFSLIAPVSVSLLLGLAAGVWITGAFHEDGFADMCDGFGGGWTREKILEIMKDSRIGTYGMTGLLLLLLLKFFCLYSLSLPQAIMAILIAHPLSRFTALTIIYTHPYVRENEDSKAKPVSKGITAAELCIAAFTGLLPLVLAACWQQQYLLLLIVPLLVPVRWYMARLMRKWIGGYTGDCLGATQQVAETIIYLCICIIAWRYT